jgi:uncharacterized membrane protein
MSTFFPTACQTRFWRIATASTEASALSVSITPSRSATGVGQIQSVDALRGAIMILMTIDHTRDFVHSAAMSFSPTDLTRTTVAMWHGWSCSLWPIPHATGMPD